jgi:hypothetical protein
MNKFTLYEIEYIIIGDIVDEIIDKIVEESKLYNKFTQLETSLLQDQTKNNNKHVTFNYQKNQILIIQNIEYINEQNLKSILWWDSNDYLIFRLTGLNNIKKYMNTHPGLTYKNALLQKYNIKVYNNINNLKIDSDLDSDSDLESDSESDLDLKTELDSESESDLDLKTELEFDSESDLDLKIESESESNSNSDSESETESNKFIQITKKKSCTNLLKLIT